MAQSIIATKPANFDAIKEGDIYEHVCFSDSELRTLAQSWKIILGNVKDSGPKNNTPVVCFYERRAR